jgi:hypothetical protein
MNNKITKIKFDTIIKYANLFCPKIYKSKFTNEYYLNNILYVLSDFVSWKSLQHSCHILSKNIYHYKTIHSIHKLWCDNNVYEYAYNEMINDNEKCKLTENIYIDNTLIINKNGSEDVGYGNGICRKKKYTALTCVVNEYNKALIIFSNKTKTKEKIYNNKNIIIKTLPHDTKSLIIATNILENINKTVYLIGDKGYIMNKNKIQNKKIILVTPKKRNQLIKNTQIEKDKLKNRYKIENWFATLKCFNRIHVRRDKLINTYIGFVFLGCICIL